MFRAMHDSLIVAAWSTTHAVGLHTGLYIGFRVSGSGCRVQVSRTGLKLEDLHEPNLTSFKPYLNPGCLAFFGIFPINM